MTLAVVIRGDQLDPHALAETSRENEATYGFFGISCSSKSTAQPWTRSHLRSSQGPSGWLCSRPVISYGQTSNCGTPASHRTTMWCTETSPNSSPDLSAARTVSSRTRTIETLMEVSDMDIELRADLNVEDDDGLNWSTIARAARPEEIVPGAIVKAGTDRFWSWVCVESVDADGQVHFRQITRREAQSSGRMVTA